MTHLIFSLIIGSKSTVANNLLYLVKNHENLLICLYRNIVQSQNEYMFFCVHFDFPRLENIENMI